MIVLILKKKVVLKENGLTRVYPFSQTDLLDLNSILVCVSSNELYKIQNILKIKSITKNNDIVFLSEEKLLQLNTYPMRIGRISGGFVDNNSFYMHKEFNILELQLKKLKDNNPKKKHFRIAIVNGFGLNLGDNVVGTTAFRVISKYLKNNFKSFSVDLFYASNANKACIDIVGYETYINKIFFESILLNDFLSYDAYFDLTNLIALPKFGTMPTVDWYLWWFGLDYKKVTELEKRNKGFVKNNEILLVRSLLKNIQEKKIFFNPNSSTSLRSIPLKIATKIVKKILSLSNNLTLIIDFPTKFKHKNLLNLQGHINSVEILKALIMEVDTIITVDTFALHWADACNKPSVLLTSSIPPNIFKYYPLNNSIPLDNYDKLPAFNKPKVEELEWIKISREYEDAWNKLDVKKIIKYL